MGGGDVPGGPGERVADLGEDRLVASLLARIAGPGGSGPPPEPVPGARLLVGPGDDAAVLAVPGSLVASTDTLVEGFDFCRDWSTAHQVGVKTAAQNLADIAAMGARPVGLLVSLAVPGELDTRWVRSLVDGAAEECARAGVGVVGGDLAEAAGIVVTGTAFGSLVGPAVLRSGARPGDVVALAGRTGPSAAGLALLSAGVHPVSAELQALVEAHRAPRPDYAAGPRAAAAGAHALIDTSDGLLRDAGRIAAASGAVLDLDPHPLASAPGLLAAARALRDAGAADPGDDPAGTATGWVLTGGEDHALLACFPTGARLPEGFRPVGRVLPAAPGTPRVLVGGEERPGRTGWLAFG